MLVFSNTVLTADDGVTVLTADDGVTPLTFFQVLAGGPDHPLAVKRWYYPDPPWQFQQGGRAAPLVQQFIPTTYLPYNPWPLWSPVLAQ